MTLHTPLRRSILLLVLLESLLVTCRKKVSEPVYDSPYDETSETYIPTPGLNTAPVTAVTAISAQSGG
jgi:hypothetical protein